MTVLDAIHPDSRVRYDLDVEVGGIRHHWPRAHVGRDPRWPSRHGDVWPMLLDARQRLRERAIGSCRAPLPLAMIVGGVEVTAYIVGIRVWPAPPATATWRAWACVIDGDGDLAASLDHCGHEHRDEAAAKTCAAALTRAGRAAAALREVDVVPIVVEAA